MANPQKGKRKTHCTPKGEAKYVFLNEPQTKLDANGVYSIGLLLPAEDSGTIALMQMIDELGEEAKAAALEAISQIDKPKKVDGKMMKVPELKKHLAETLQVSAGYDTDYDEEGNDTGYILFKFKMKAQRKDKDGNMQSQRPNVCDAKVKKIDLDKTNIGSGSTMLVQFRIQDFYMEGSNTIFLTNYIAAVQVIDLVEFGAGGFSGFSEQEGYSADDDEDTDFPTEYPEENGNGGDF